MGSIAALNANSYLRSKAHDRKRSVIDGVLKLIMKEELAQAGGTGKASQTLYNKTLMSHTA